MTVRAKSKHVGHACEGHLRGILKHIPGVRAEHVVRALPFDAPVEPDAVMLDGSGRVRAVFIVAFWGEAGSSHKKLHRTRTEFNESRRAQLQQPDAFTDDFQIVTVIYGADGGWKEQILLDLAGQCAPMLFLPRVLEKGAAENIVGRAFKEYCVIWESGDNDAREQLEAAVAGRVLTGEETSLLKLLQKTLRTRVPIPANHVAAAERTRSRIPPGELRTRYRQALGLLSLFANREVLDWQATHNPATSAEAERFARRAHFLGMGELSSRKSILGSEIATFSLRAPYDGDGRYEPSRPDFCSWQTLDSNDIEWILDAHREKTRHVTKVFRGGAFDQCAGNFADICTVLSKEGLALSAALRSRNTARAIATIAGSSSVTAETWHPASGQARLFPVWSLGACALATAHGDRAIRTAFDTRRQDPPDASMSRRLVRDMCASPDAIDLFEEAVRFASQVVSTDLVALSKVPRSPLFSLDEPCSWTADLYMTLTTNSSHNPLNEILRRWLVDRFPNVEWRGWPNTRSVSPKVLVADCDARRQWCFVGRSRGLLIGAETKAITGNHWGDKSKELYDKVAELRRVSSEARLRSLGILLFDGDLASDVARELSTGIGHDEIWGVDEVLASLRNGLVSTVGKV